MHIFVLDMFSKQKTAYDVRISDWSSDVCSSDLRRRALVFEQRDVAVGVDQEAARIEQRALVVGLRREQPRIAHPAARAADVAGLELTGGLRSEEHTSELQSLMRISYAVFCLKKNKETINITHTSS